MFILVLINVFELKKYFWDQFHENYEIENLAVSLIAHWQWAGHVIRAANEKGAKRVELFRATFRRQIRKFDWFPQVAWVPLIFFLND